MPPRERRRREPKPTARDLFRGRTWRVAWFRAQPYMHLTLGRTAYVPVRFTGFVFENSAGAQVRYLGWWWANDMPLPLTEAMPYPS